jgi:hypothetical protein
MIGKMVEPTLQFIHAQLERLLEGQRLAHDDMQDVKRRLTSLEVQVATLHGDFAGQSLRIDRIEQRLGRIEQRLDLVEA